MPLSPGGVPDCTGTVTTLLKKHLLGRAMSTGDLDHTLLPKRLALPVFCSDPLSSVAYATQEILLVLVIGGTAAIALAPWVAAAVILLMVIVVASYRQTVFAYPNGGGAYAVSKENLGPNAALVAASALLVDYVLTVAVSVTAGVANIASAFPAVAEHAVFVSIALICLLALMNLRGVKESGTVFAIPTYGFVLAVGFLLVSAIVGALSGHAPRAESAGLPIDGQNLETAAMVFLVLRAFASGCTALTGVEAVSNGVPFFRRPKSRNASLTLAGMAALAISMFGGITWLAISSGVRYSEHPETLGLPAGTEQPTVVAQLGMAVFGAHGIGFYVLQAFTAAILILAANTAFNGFPVLASILGADDYLPRQFGRRGDRLVFSNGIIILTVIASGLVYLYDASATRLIQLYILGVFVSFTLSQAGMVVHWNRLIRSRQGDIGKMRRSRLINAVGATMTSLVLVIVIVSKFSHGAWMVAIAIPVLVAMMLVIHRHYVRSDEATQAPDGGVRLPTRIHSIVLVSKVNAPMMRALSFARAARPDTLVCLHVSTDPEESRRLIDEWDRRQLPVPLVVVGSPYRDISRPVLEYIAEMDLKSTRDVISVYLPEQVTHAWWPNMLHNQSAIRLKARLLFQPSVMVTSVPTVVD